MAIPLGWIGAETLEEPLYVAGSHMVIRMAAHTDPADMDEGGSGAPGLEKGEGSARIQSQNHSLTMTRPH
jgi:hypothetical protein